MKALVLLEERFRPVFAGLAVLLFTALASAIDAPKDLLTHSQPQDAAVILSWTPVAGATSYRVLRGTTYGSYSQIAEVTALSYVDDAFPTDATSYYVVRAYDGTESTNSNAVSFTPQELILSPDRIVIIVNDNSADSVEVGNYYAAQRGVPVGNICHVTTNTTEFCTQAEYDDLASQINSFLDSNGLRDSTYCLLTTYGIPPRISGSCAVDNSLATLRAGTGSNDYYSPGIPLPRRYDGTYSVYMVTRIDGADKNIANGLVDKALAAEADPDFYSSGIGVFDARRHAYSSAYALGDRYSRDACLAARRIGFTIYLNDDSDPIHDGEVTEDVLLYWGWYTHYYGAPDTRLGEGHGGDLTFAELEDPFTFATGAVAVHLESSTCSRIRLNDVDNWRAHYWVPWLINYKGVTATGGAVDEPFLSGYAKGDRFFETLTKGYSFAEAAYISTPGVNWMMCWVGDPLYTPFRKRLRNHYRVYGRRNAQVTMESRCNVIAADSPNMTFFNTTYGVFYLTHWSDAEEHRYVLDFPTIFDDAGGAVQSGADIVSSRLLMRATHSANDAGPLSFYRITDPDGKGAWKQSWVDDADNVGVSWAYRDASTGTPWDNASTQGGTYSTSDVASYTGGMSWRKLVDADVTAHVQAWADGAVNQGWIITIPLGQGDNFWGGDYAEAPVDAPLLEVYWNAGPVAAAGENTSAILGEVVPFDGSASYDPDFGPSDLSYSWDFDASDGIQVDATGPTPTHQFTISKLHTVTLTVSDGKVEAQDTLTVNVTGTDTTPPAIDATHAVLSGTVSDDMFCPTQVMINGTIAVPVAVVGLNGTWTSAPVDFMAASGVLTIIAEDASSNTTTVTVTITQ